MRESILALSAASGLPQGASGPAGSGGALSGAPKKVIVLGAGLAGLSAAYELTQLGHEVVILEATLRPGGRVLTLRGPFSDQLYAEAGAQFFSDLHPFVLKYVGQFKLPLVTIAADQFIPRYEIKGKWIIEGMQAGQDGPEWPVALTAAERKLGLIGMMKAYLGPALANLGDPTDPNWPPDPVKKYDELTFSAFLKEQGASDGAISLFGTTFSFWGNGIHTVSSLCVLRDLKVGTVGTVVYALQGGNDTLPRAFAASLSTKIRYGAPAQRIEHDEKSVRAVFTQAGGSQTLSADHLICAIPFSVLRTMDVSPAFSAVKARAIAELPYTSVARVYLQSSSRFWVGGGPDSWTYTDLPVMSVIDSTANQPGARGILQSYMSGPQARHMSAMTGEKQVRASLANMAALYPHICQYFEGGTAQCWDEAEWARGAYAWFMPGQMTSLLPYIAPPEGRVHFAGDHTSPYPGWMQGALESGNRVAQEVDQAPS